MTKIPGFTADASIFNARGYYATTMFRPSTGEAPDSVTAMALPVLAGDNNGLCELVWIACSRSCSGLPRGSFSASNCFEHCRNIVANCLDAPEFL